MSATGNFFSEFGQGGAKDGVIDALPRIFKGTAFWASATAPTQQTLFLTKPTLPNDHGSRVFPLSSNRAAQIFSISATLNAEFALWETSATVGDAHLGFINRTQLKFMLDGNEIFEMYLVNALPYTIQRIGASYTTFVKEQEYFTLPEPIFVPEGGELSIQVIPATGISTIAAAAANPHYATSASANSQGATLELYLPGIEYRRPRGA